ncbi:MAG TPA: hypothetical protein DD381_07050 [Lentisphaeria bacterium]|nr:MAG: hypothetical protein A2X47_10855 [Lentisphaerae bacterium GWF2_38_69]HBM16081.1 hypothetical protein [Lentisphaeria bacterium]
MNNKHKATLQKIFEKPPRPDVNWKDIEKLLIALGAIVKEREGSRIGVFLNGRVAIFHRPHPQKETDKGALVSVRKFLENAEVKHDL